MGQYELVSLIGYVGLFFLSCTLGCNGMMALFILTTLDCCGVVSFDCGRVG